jgi:hypothetical protein
MNMTVGVPASGGNVRLEDDVLGGKVRDNGVAVGAASLGERHKNSSQASLSRGGH